MKAAQTGKASETLDSRDEGAVVLGEKGERGKGGIPTWLAGLALLCSRISRSLATRARASLVVVGGVLVCGRGARVASGQWWCTSRNVLARSGLRSAVWETHEAVAVVNFTLTGSPSPSVLEIWISGSSGAWTNDRPGVLGDWRR